MSLFKIFFLGFSISFIGSIPFGYLNIIGYEMYLTYGFKNMLFYLLGIVLIEYIYIFFTFQIAEQLTKIKKLIKIIDIFSVFFMFFLATYFFINSSATNSNSSNIPEFFNRSTFFTGIILSSINFIQIPFWLNWNLYVINLNNNQKIKKSYKFSYLLSAIIGTFLGMLFFIISLNELMKKFENLNLYLFKIIIPVIFIGLGVLQLVNLIRKNNSKLN